jgi:hypothetical protein
LDHSFKSKLAVTTALVAAFCGYGRRAYAACSPTGSATYLCSGYNVSTQTISANEATVSTVSGFGVNTASGNAITVTGDGALSFTDIYASTIKTTASATSLYVHALADDGPTPGSITINANSTITGGEAGIFAFNNGTGATTVTANGDVTATDAAIASVDITATSVTITTGTGSTITGGEFGIIVDHNGTGGVTITADGTVTGTGGYGITVGDGSTATNLSITTGTGSNITGGTYGIHARNLGSGYTSITANGNVTGTTGEGIYAYNGTSATNLSITTGTGSNITGGTQGIFVKNFGTGYLSITANGGVTGTTGPGI